MTSPDESQSVCVNSRTFPAGVQLLHSSVHRLLGCHSCCCSLTLCAPIVIVRSKAHEETVS